MSERTSTVPRDTETLLAYVLTSISMASAWHLEGLPAGLWIGNAVAGALGITLGLWATSKQPPRLFCNWKRDLLTGAWVGLGLVLVCQFGTRWLLWRIPGAREELLRLYAVLRTPPGPALASPVLLLVVVAEELVFRGAVTTYLQKRQKPVAVIILATGLYALPLIASGSWLLPLVGLTVGGASTFARQRTNGLTVPLLAHALFSLTTFVWLPIN